MGRKQANHAENPHKSKGGAKARRQQDPPMPPKEKSSGEGAKKTVSRRGKRRMHEQEARRGANGGEAGTSPCAPTEVPKKKRAVPVTVVRCPTHLFQLTVPGVFVAVCAPRAGSYYAVAPLTRG